MKRKSKRKQPSPEPQVDALYKAVQAWVEHNGGKLVVIGGIQVQQWPQDREFIFHVAVKCMGRLPKFTKMEQK